MAIGVDARRSDDTTRGSAGDAGLAAGAANRRLAKTNATTPEASVPATAAISGARSRLPSTRTSTRAAAVPRLSVSPRE